MGADLVFTRVGFGSLTHLLVGDRTACGKKPFGRITNPHGNDLTTCKACRKAAKNH